jgi:uncharacterized SAM-binding protein YcdF (DUF218 family)
MSTSPNANRLLACSSATNRISPVSSDYTPTIISDQKDIDAVANLAKQRDPIGAIDFHLLTDVLAELGITDDPFSYISDDGWDSQAIHALRQEAFAKLSTKRPASLQASLYRLWDYLATADTLEPADIIFVFGGEEIQRAETAISLLVSGHAQRILFSGHSPRHSTLRILPPEAELFAQRARAKGVTEGQIIIENRSTNTLENVVFSIKLMHDLALAPPRVILITSPYHMLRAYLTFRAAADWQPTFIRHPFESSRYNRDNFATKEAIWSYVFLEYLKIYGARAMRHF